MRPFGEGSGDHPSPLPPVSMQLRARLRRGREQQRAPCEVQSPGRLQAEPCCEQDHSVVGGSPARGCREGPRSRTALQLALGGLPSPGFLSSVPGNHPKFSFRLLAGAWSPSQTALAGQSSLKFPRQELGNAAPVLRPSPYPFGSLIRPQSPPSTRQSRHCDVMCGARDNGDPFQTAP